MEEGSPGDALYVVLDGQFEVTKHSGKQDVLLGLRGSIPDEDHQSLTRSRRWSAHGVPLDRF